MSTARQWYERYRAVVRGSLNSVRIGLRSVRLCETASLF